MWELGGRIPLLTALSRAILPELRWSLGNSHPRPPPHPPTQGLGGDQGPWLWSLRSQVQGLAFPCVSNVSPPQLSGLQFCCLEMQQLETPAPQGCCEGSNETRDKVLGPCRLALPSFLALC